MGCKEKQDCINYITCPTLTIHGKDDTIVPSESTEYVYNTIKSKTNILYNIKNVTHDCFRNHQDVKDIIKEFLVNTPNNTKETINL